MTDDAPRYQLTSRELFRRSEEAREREREADRRTYEAEVNAAVALLSPAQREELDQLIRDGWELVLHRPWLYEEDMRYRMVLRKPSPEILFAVIKDGKGADG